MGKKDSKEKEDIYTKECSEQIDSSTEDETESIDDDKPCDGEELKRQLEQLKEESKANLALAQRVQADFDNFRRRNKNISAEYYDIGVGELALEFLSVLDNLDRALSSMEEGDCPKSYIEGIEMVVTQFKTVLEKFEITEIEALGKPFDPNLHHAVAQEEAKDGQEKNTVIEVLQTGYKHKDKALRYSMVKVSK